MITFEVPYPPSANRYWRMFNNRMVISSEAKQYMYLVDSIVSKSFRFDPLDGIKVVSAMYPPDNRKRDLDNALKVLLDSFERAGVYENDSQIKEIHATMMPVLKPGKVVVSFERIEI